MNAQTAAKPTAVPQTPSLPEAKPESLGLSAARLQRIVEQDARVRVCRTIEVIDQVGVVSEPLPTNAYLRQAG